MKRILCILCLFFTFKLSACSDCVKKICILMKKNHFEVAHTKFKTYDETNIYNEGVTAGVRYSLAIINSMHPGAQLTLEEYEAILGKKIDE